MCVLKSQGETVWFLFCVHEVLILVYEAVLKLGRGPGNEALFFSSTERTSCVVCVVGNCQP